MTVAIGVERSGGMCSAIATCPSIWATSAASLHAIELLQVVRPESLHHDGYVDGDGFREFVKQADCETLCWRWRAIGPCVKRLSARLQARRQRPGRDQCRHPTLIQPVERWRSSRSDADDIGDGVHTGERRLGTARFNTKIGDCSPLRQRCKLGLSHDQPDNDFRFSPRCSSPFR